MAQTLPGPGSIPYLLMEKMTKVFLCPGILSREELLFATGSAWFNPIGTAKILLSRATPLGPHNGPLLDEEREFRRQATVQQKLFLATMDKLQPKPVRPMGGPPAKESA